MKSFLIASLFILGVSNSHASSMNEEMICKSLEDQAWQNCRVYMCEESVENNTPEEIRECLNSGEDETTFRSILRFSLD